MAGSGATHDAAGWGGRLRSYRKNVLGLNQQQFAEALNKAGAKLGYRLFCDQQHISRWECRVVKQPSDEYVTALRELGAPVPGAGIDVHHDVLDAEIVPYSSVPDVITVDDVDRRKFLATVTAATVVGSTSELAPWFPRSDVGSMPVPGRVGMADVEFVRSVTAGLRGLDHRHGGYAVIDSASGLLGFGRGLLTRCDDRATMTSMLAALADLAGLTGWAYHDIGDQGRARSYLALALSYARNAGAGSLAASILYVLGRVSLVEQQPREALRMFRLGQISAQDALNAGESARLYANEAWAHAMMGNRQHMLDALARSEHEIARAHSAEPDPWTAVFFTVGEHAGLTSVIFNELALATDDRHVAEEFTTRALERTLASLEMSTRSTRPIRSVLFDHTTAAAARFRLGDTASAVESADSALGMTAEVLSARVVTRLQAMAESAQPYCKRPDVREVCYQVHQLALSAPRALTRYPARE
jgi:hypothetical protein